MKIFRKLIFTCLLIISFTIQVSASDSRHDWLVSKKGGSAVLMCEYADFSGEIQNEIYFSFTLNGLSTDEPWGVTLRSGMFNTLDIGSSTHGTFEKVFVKTISYDFHEGHMQASKEKQFTCPKYSFVDYDGINEICFSDNESCGLNFERGPYKLTENSETIYSVMDGFIKTAFDSITFEEYKSSSSVSSIESTIKSKSLTATKERYGFETSFVTPEFVTNYIENDSNLKSELERFKSRMETALNEANQKNELTEQEKEDLNKKNEELKQMISSNNFVPSTGVDPDGDESCNSILGSEMSEIINNIFKTIQYAGPVLVIVLTALDMLKAVTSGEQDQMKKATNKFTKRLIAAMLLFFVPLLCSLVFDIVGITVPDSCIGTLK